MEGSGFGRPKNLRIRNTAFFGYKGGGETAKRACIETYGTTVLIRPFWENASSCRHVILRTSKKYPFREAIPLNGMFGLAGAAAGQPDGAHPPEERGDLQATPAPHGPRGSHRQHQCSRRLFHRPRRYWYSSSSLTLIHPREPVFLEWLLSS